MYCVNCGNELEGSPRFCYICGQPPAQAGPSTGRPATLTPPPVKPPKPKRKKGRPRWVLTCGMVALALILACSVALGGAYFFLGLHRTNQTAKIVPADTGALVTISPSLLQAPQLRDAQDKAAGAGLLAALPGVVELAEAVQDELSLELDVTPDDVLPWIGREVGLAILYQEARASDAGGGPPGPAAPLAQRAYHGPPILLTAATRSEKKSDAFLADLRDQLEDEGVEFDEDTYRGVEITEIVEPDGLPLAYATFSKLVVVATDPDTLRDAIDASLDGGRVLNQQDEYKEMLRELPSNRLGTIYLDWPAMVEYLGADELEELPLGGLAAIQDIGVAFSLQKSGVLYDYVVRYDLTRLTDIQQETLRQGSSKHKLTEFAPADSFAYLSGQNLLLAWQVLAESGFWEDVAEVQKNIIQSIDPTAEVKESDLVEDIEDETGVHLVDDLLVKMNGEYAWVWAPDTDGYMGDEDLPLGFLLLVQVKDRPEVEQSLQGLFDALTEDGDVDLNREEISGVEFWLVEDRYEEVVLFGYGFVDDVLFVGSSEAMVELLAEAQDRPLARSEPFRGAVAPLPGDSRGYLFLDVEQIVKWVTRTMSDYEREDFEETVEPYLESVRALSMGNAPMSKKGLMRGVLFAHTETK